MPKSPSSYLKRKNVWSHVPGHADPYQPGALHSHDRDVTTTGEGEKSQEAWPDVSPDKKGLEDTSSPI